MTSQVAFRHSLQLARAAAYISRTNVSIVWYHFMMSYEIAQANLVLPYILITYSIISFWKNLSDSVKLCSSFKRSLLYHFEAHVSH